MAARVTVGRSAAAHRLCVRARVARGIRVYSIRKSDPYLTLPTRRRHTMWQGNQTTRVTAVPRSPVLSALTLDLVERTTISFYPALVPCRTDYGPPSAPRRSATWWPRAVTESSRVTSRCVQPTRDDRPQTTRHVNVGMPSSQSRGRRRRIKEKGQCDAKRKYVQPPCIKIENVIYGECHCFEYGFMNTALQPRANRE